MSVRNRICNSIAKLPENASLEQVSKQINRFLSEDPAADNPEDGVTPLMVACDKGQAACLEYILQNPSMLLWGRPDDQSSEQTGANTALHHAAVAGCVEAIDVLVAMGCLLIDLVRHVNHHGDTPVMMACVYHQVDFLQKIKEKLGDDLLLTELLSAKNASGERPLSLAFGHGHAQVLQFLLSSGVEASYEAVKECKEKLRQMDAILSKAGVSDGNLIEERRTNVKRCLVILELSLAQKASDSMEQLIQKDNQEKEEKRKNTPKKPSSVRKHADPRKVPATPRVNTEKTNNETSSNAWISQRGDSESIETVTQPKFRTLPDGSVVKNVADCQPFRVEVEEPGAKETKQEPKSVDEMLRERLREPIHDVDAVMDSLCLDASMLLLSPHGMAMNLSPSQLESIDSILRKQIKSVQDAKDIQERLLNAGFGERLSE